MLDLRRPIYKQTAAYGHFGRTDIDLPWEQTDKAEALKELAGNKYNVNAGSRESSLLPAFFLIGNGVWIWNIGVQFSETVVQISMCDIHVHLPVDK